MPVVSAVLQDVVSIADAQRASASRRQPASEPDGLRLRIVDAADLGPLPDASVRWRADGGPWCAEHVGHDAVARLSCEVGARIELQVRCDGYCRLCGLLTVVDGSAEVPMQPAGVVEVRVCDVDGKPEAGVEVALLPPLAGGRWIHDWLQLRSGQVPLVPNDALPRLEVADGSVAAAGESLLNRSRAIAWHLLAHAPLQRATDADGVARWVGVAPADAYRCGVLGRHHAELDPAHESQRLRVTATGVVVGRSPPQNMSGRFAVTAGECAQIEATVLGEAAVHGRLVCRPGADIRVRLCRISQAGGGDVRPVTTVDKENHQQIDRAGRFRFEGVRPGVFAIRACWRESEHDIYCASATFRLLPGMDLDLGEVSPTAGSTVRVRAELHENGQRVAPERVFVEPGRAAANLAFAFLPDSGSIAEAVREVAVVPFGVDYLVHGVPPGRLRVKALPISGMATLPRVQRIDEAESVVVPAEPLRDVVAAAIHVHGGVEVRFSTVDERGGVVPVRSVHAVHLATGFVQSLAIDPATGAATMSEGRHLLGASLFVEGRWLAGVVECDVSVEAPSVHLDMLSAATIRGRFAAGGSGRRDSRLRWSPAAFAKSGVWLYAARTNAAGEFELEGIPPGVELHGDDGLPTLPAVGSGQVLDVDTIVRR